MTNFSARLVSLVVLFIFLRAFLVVIKGFALPFLRIHFSLESAVRLTVEVSSAGVAFGFHAVLGPPPHYASFLWLRGRIDCKLHKCLSILLFAASLC